MTAQSGVLVENVQVDIVLDDGATVLMTAYTDQTGAFVADGHGDYFAPHFGFGAHYGPL